MRILQIKSVTLIFIGASVTVPAFALDPTYEEDMARQREQERQIMEEGNRGEEEAAAQYYYEQETEQQEASDSAAESYEPMQSRLKTAVSMAEIVASSSQRTALFNDPNYQRYLNGGWDFFQGRSNALPGEYCTAFFWKKESFVSLSGPGGSYKGALLSFWGPNIPRPARQEKIKVTLKQDKETPQTVQAFNFTIPGNEYGAIALAVPSMEALLAGMEEVQNFELELNGKAVAKVGWRNGMAARKALQACVEAKK